MENNINKIGASQKAILLNNEGKLLTIRRTKTAPVRPLHWDLPGGDLDFGEDPMQGMIREIKEETGLDVKNVEPFDIEAHINSDGVFWITVAYRVENVSGDLALSYEHDQYKWVTPDEFLQLKSADKLQRFVKKLKQKMT